MIACRAGRYLEQEMAGLWLCRMSRPAGLVVGALWLLVWVASAPLLFAEARVRRYKWEVKYEYKSPDCYKKLVITINGKTPGPTILAQQNDTVVVEVKNGLLTENLAIHWHGIRQVS